MGELPLDMLLPRTEDLTKGWLLALLEQAPLDDAPAILAADLARDGPRICDAVLRALASDEDLRRLEAGGQLEQLIARAGQLAAAEAPDGVSQAVDALQAVVWSAVRATFIEADGDQVAELAQRLSEIAELVRVAALRRSAAPRHRPEPVMREIKIARGGEGAVASAAAPGALWVGAVQDEIAHAERFDLPLALLLVELEDGERILASESPADASATFGRFAQALRSVVRRRDILASETETRAWIIARETGRSGAQALANRAANAVSEAQPWRGAPMTVCVGVAVLREDGRDAASLIEAAEESKYAAAAAGVPVLGERPGEENGEPTGGPGPRLVS